MNKAENPVINWGFKWKDKPVGLIIPETIPFAIALQAEMGYFPPDHIHVSISDQVILIQDLRQAVGVKGDFPFNPAFFEELVKERLPLDGSASGVNIVIG